MITLPKRLSSTLGIELEFNCIDGAGYATDGTYKVGERWDAVSEHCGIELKVDTVFRTGPTFERNLDELLAWAKDKTTGTNNCGVHVHLGLPSSMRRSGKMNPRYARFLLENERFFFGLVPPTRAFGYNPPWLNTTCEALIKEFKLNRDRYVPPTWAIDSHGWSGPSGGEFASVEGFFTPTEEYTSLEYNLDMLASERLWFTGPTDHDTIEYRLLQGTYEREVIVGWVAFLDFIHRKALAAELPDTTVSPSDTRDQVFSKFISATQPRTQLKQWLETQYDRNHFPNFIASRDRACKSAAQSSREV